MLTRRQIISTLGLSLLAAPLPSLGFTRTFLHDRKDDPVEDWVLFLRSIQGKSLREKAQRVNNYVNTVITYRLDIDNHGVEDYWASPLETLRNGLGDCDDISLLKYSGLLVSGIDTSQVRLAYGYLNEDYPLGNSPQAHLVVAVLNTESEPWLLCNTTDLMLTPSQKNNFDLKVTANEKGMWKEFRNEVPSSMDTSAVYVHRKWREAGRRVDQDGKLIRIMMQ